MKLVDQEPHPKADIRDHTKLYAVICPQPGQGILSAGDSVETQKPLVFMSKAMVDDLIPHIKKMFSGHGRKVEVREYEWNGKSINICDK